MSFRKNYYITNNYHNQTIYNYYCRCVCLFVLQTEKRPSDSFRCPMGLLKFLFKVIRYSDSPACRRGVWSDGVRTPSGHCGDTIRTHRPAVRTPSGSTLNGLVLAPAGPCWGDGASPIVRDPGGSWNSVHCRGPGGSWNSGRGRGPGGPLSSRRSAGRHAAAAAQSPRRA